MNRRVFAAVVMASAGCALAQDGAAPVPEAAPSAKEAGAPAIEDPEKWSVRFEPSGWYAGLSGKMSMPGGAGSGDRVEVVEMNLDGTRWAPMGELSMRNGPWTVQVSGFGFETGDRDATADRDLRLGSLDVAQGDALESSVNLWSAEATVAYDPKWLPDRMTPGVSANFGARFEVIGGVRLTGVEANFASGGAGVGSDELFGEPVVGARLTLDILERLSIDLHSTVGYWPTGGGRSSVTWDIVLGGQWRPVENVGVQVGYRQLAFDLQDGDRSDDFTYRGALAGLYAGVVIRF